MIYLSLGANLLNPYHTLKKALKLIQELENTTLVKVSPFYQTSPVSSIKQEDFLNLACSLISTLSPFELLDKLQEIETRLGKKPKGKEEPRIIDIDMLFYYDQIISSSRLTLPHSEWKNRLFVLVPLKDLTCFINLSNERIDLKKLIQEFPFKTEQKITLFTPKEKHEQNLYSPSYH